MAAQLHEHRIENLFMDLGPQKEFVDFTLTEMKRPTKMFRKWYNYCVFKTKEENDKPSQGLRD